MTESVAGQKVGIPVTLVRIKKLTTRTKGNAHPHNQDLSKEKVQ